MLDLPRLYTNDIHAMARVYGIEAAYQAIIKVRWTWLMGVGKERRWLWLRV